MDALTIPIPSASADEQQKMIQAMACVVRPGTATYVSGPITTGLVFIQWYQLEGKHLRGNKADYDSSFREKVITLNENAILDVAIERRKFQSSPVIEPASLFISDWTQSDYIAFWIRVLGRFVREMVLVEGWQFSAGCAAEFKFAIDNGFLIRARDGTPISRKEGNRLIAGAISDLEGIAAGDIVLCALSASLRKVVLESL